MTTSITTCVAAREPLPLRRSRARRWNSAAAQSDVGERLNPRTGKTQAIQGTVTSDGLDKIEITLRDGDRRATAPWKSSR